MTNSVQDLSPLAQGIGTKSESRSVIGQLTPFLCSYWSKMTQFSILDSTAHNQSPSHPTEIITNHCQIEAALTITNPENPKKIHRVKMLRLVSTASAKLLTLLK